MFARLKLSANARVILHTRKKNWNEFFTPRKKGHRCDKYLSIIYRTFVEIDHEMISTVILLPSADSFKKGCCQLQAKVCARITG